MNALEYAHQARLVAEAAPVTAVALEGVAPSRNLSGYAIGAPELIQLGYSTIRVRPGTKRPYGNGWQEYCRAPATAEEVAEWSQGRFGIGIATGTIVNAYQVIAIDVDLTGDELDQALAALPVSPMEKGGRKGLTRFYLGEPTLPSRKYVRPNHGGERGADTMVDFQADRKQVVVPPTLHPDTGRSYFWQRGPVPACELPVLTADDLERFEDTLRHLGWDGGAKPDPREPREREAAGDESIWEELNARALSGLGSWVPALDLYNWHRAGDRYEAVPTWRDSNSGTPLERRKRSLGIHPSGIRDFGTGEGLSPLTLVHLVLGGSRDDAFRWLAEKVGLLGELDTTVPSPEIMVTWELKSKLAKAEAEIAKAKRANDNLVLPPTKPRIIQATPFILRHPSELPRREWLMGKFAIRKEVSMTVAPGGVGKTAFGLAEAVAMASGRELLGAEIGRPLRVWVWNGEEPFEEMERRLGAICLHYGVEEHELGGRLFVDTEDDVELVLAEEKRGECTILHPIVDALVEEMLRRKIDVMIVDPFVSTHKVKENDNNSMQTAASAWKRVAKRANASILLSHHTRKSNGQQVTSDSSRGGDAAVSKARAVRALNIMTKDEADFYEVNEAERRSLFSVDVGLGKFNMSARSDDRAWYKNTNVPLYNKVRGNIDVGDEIGVVKRWTPPDIWMAEMDDNATTKLQEMLVGGYWLSAPQSQSKPDWVGVAVAQVFGIDVTQPNWKARAKANLRQLLESGAIRAVRERNSDYKLVMVARPPEDFVAQSASPASHPPV